MDAAAIAVQQAIPDSLGVHYVFFHSTSFSGTCSGDRPTIGHVYRMEIVAVDYKRNATYRKDPRRTRAYATGIKVQATPGV